MKPFTENDRFNYTGLTSFRWVLDIGAHAGKSAFILAQKYGCHVVCYEPVTEFYNQLAARCITESFDKPNAGLIFPVKAAVGAEDGHALFGVHGDLSGEFCASDKQDAVTVEGIKSVLERWTTKFGEPPFLVMINAEGGEHVILETMLDQGLECQMKHLQVQPHAVVPDYAERWANIKRRLALNFKIAAEDPDFGTGWLLMEQK